MQQNMQFWSYFIDKVKLLCKCKSFATLLKRVIYIMASLAVDTFWKAESAR